MSASNMMIGMAFIAGVSVVAQEAPGCKKFKDIYPTGKELCENMWDGAFKYEPDEDMGYTMWFQDMMNNPNDKTTKKLMDAGVFSLETERVEQCHLQYFHKAKGDPAHPLDNKEHPTEEPDSFTECYPWANRGCCHQEVVESPKKMKESYGTEYHWDRCGALSQACERFFVMEACFYECEPNAGIYRKHKETKDDPDPFGGSTELHTDPDCVLNNPWQMHQMPIKASFCDGWHHACSNDYFCAEDEGSFFSCAKQWKPIDLLNEKPKLPGSCEKSCGKKSETGPCMCDEGCENEDPPTCCADREEYCRAKWVEKPYGSCAGACNKKTKTDGGTCWCDSNCVKNHDCCDDKEEECSNFNFFNGSCKDSCGKKSKSKGAICYCDSACKKQKIPDCCEDIDELCSQ